MTIELKKISGESFIIPPTILVDEEEKQLNYIGDISLSEHGGTFIIQEDETSFTIVSVDIDIYFDSLREGEHRYIVSNAYVDLDTDWINFKEVRNYDGLGEKCANYELAYATFNYYGYHNFCGRVRNLYGEEHLYLELATYGIDKEEISNGKEE